MWRNFHAFGVGQVVLVEFRKALNHAHRRQGRPEDVILGKQNFHQEPFASLVFRGLALFYPKFDGVQDCSKKTKSDPIAVHKGRAMIRALEHEVMSGLPQSKGETTIDIFVLWAAIRHDGERDALEECLRCHFHAPFHCLILPKHFELEAVLPQVDHADSSHHIISLALGPCTKL